MKSTCGAWLPKLILMDSGELKKYFRKRINNVIREFSTRRSERTEETFHRLRVEIKKIKALYQLINFCDKTFHKSKSLQPFKEVFARAGDVRNFQIEENLISDFGLKAGNKKVTAALHKKQDKAIRKFEKVIGKKLVKQIQKSGKQTEPFFEKIKEKELDGYFEKTFSKTDKLIKNRFEASKLHKTRMELKEFLYNTKLKLPLKDKLVNHLDNLQELIGSWHDCIFTIEYLDELVLNGKLKPNEVRHLKTVRQKVVRKKNLFIPKINQSRIRLKSIIKPYVK